MPLIEISEKQLLALKAVVYGCNTNKKLAGASYMTGISSDNPKTISFYEAIGIMNELLEKLEDTE